MKKLSLITFLLLFVFSPLAKAQNSDLYQFMAEYLSKEESDKIDNAKSNMKKGEKLESKIKSEDRKVSKYFKSKKKSKKKKGEKKSVAVKQLRIQQASYYEQAYSAIFTVYLDKVNSCKFEYDSDKTKVDGLIEEANTNVNSAKRTIKSFNKKKKSDLKKRVEYSKLKSELQSAVNKYKSSINNMIESYSIFLDQKQKKQLEEADDDAWTNAKSENTIHGYQAYLNSYRNGKHAAEARALIKTLDAELKKAEKRKINGTLIYRVQIAASHTPLPRWKIAKFHRNTKEVTTKHYDDWYKYSIGSFKKYAEAKAYLGRISVEGAFVVAYVDGAKIDIERAIAGE